MNKKGTILDKTWNHVETLRRIIYDLENNSSLGTAIPTTKALRKMMKKKGIDVCLRQIYRYLKILRDAKCIESNIKGCTRPKMPSRKGILIRKGTKFYECRGDGYHSGLQIQINNFKGKKVRKFFKQRTLISLRYNKARDFNDDKAITKRMYTDALVIMQISTKEHEPLMQWLNREIIREAEYKAMAQEKALKEDKELDRVLEELREDKNKKQWEEVRAKDEERERLLLRLPNIAKESDNQLSKDADRVLLAAGWTPDNPVWNDMKAELMLNPDNPMWKWEI